jgi:hypothetical protein
MIDSMAFSEALKLEVKQKAAFTCCRCRRIGVEIHHIIPQEENGPDTIDNAAPLCPACHDEFGANPVKRKQIREMRDWWYGKVEVMYGGDSTNRTLLENLAKEVEALRSDKSNEQKTLGDLKETLKQLADTIIEKTTAENAADTASELYDLAQPKLVLAKVSELKHGPIRHKNLPESLLNRITLIHRAFAPYLSPSLEQTIESFKRDMHPEREIRIWEKMAFIVETLKHVHTWDDARVKAAIGPIIALSAGPLLPQIVRQSGLTDAEIETIVGLWYNGSRA